MCGISPHKPLLSEVERSQPLHIYEQEVNAYCCVSLRFRSYYEVLLWEYLTASASMVGMFGM